MGLLACTSKPDRAPGHESQLQKKTCTHTQQVRIIHWSIVKDVITTISHFHFQKHSLSLCLKGGQGGQWRFFLMRHHTNRAKIEAYLHDVTVYPNIGIEGMQSVKEGGKERKRKSERTSMPGQRENTL